MTRVAETIERARAAAAADEDDDALAIAHDAIAHIDLVRDADTGWALAELLMELGDHGTGLGLAARLAEASGSTDAVVRRARLLDGVGEDEQAAALLRDAAMHHGPTPEIMGQLLECALAGRGWQILDDLPVPPPSVTAMIDEARRRADGFSLDRMDSRRIAYVLARVVVLGGSEDEGDMVAPYWFFNIDEHEAAWFLRRLISWLEVDHHRPATIEAADSAIRPIALALASRLGVPCQAAPGALRLYSSLAQIEDAATSDGLTACLGVVKPVGWPSLLGAAPVDAVGVFAPVDLMWSDDDELGSSEAPPADRVAGAILAELRRLPSDPGLAPMVEFYRRHRLRGRSRA